MSIIKEEMTTAELLRIAADYSQERIVLSDEERQHLVAALKKHAEEELEYGQEIECETVRVVRRVTGAVGVYFRS